MDLLQECMSDVRDQDPKEFRAIFCAHCRNPKCALAEWKEDLFGRRMATQAERLLNPTQVDPTSIGVRVTNFVDRTHQAETVELHNRRGDWESPPQTEDLGLPDPSDTDVASEATPVAPPKAPISNFRPPIGNTPMPSEGLMVGGSAPPASQSRRQVTADLWDATPAGAKVVKPGARIQIGKKP